MEYKSRKIYYIFGLLLFILIGTYGAQYVFKNGIQILPDHTTSLPEFSDFTLSKPYLLAHGSLIERIEVWAIPTGTRITEKDYIFLGMMERETNSEWRFTIPQKSILATEIFAKAFDKSGDLIKTITLPYEGASEINQALWGEEDLSNEKTVLVGEEKLFESLKFKINNIVEDSRCPQGVTCVWAGRVQAEAFFQLDGATTTALLSTDGDDFHFSIYAVRIIEVSPEPTAGSEINQSEYRLKLRFKK